MPPTLLPTRTGTLHRDGLDIFWEYFGEGQRPVVCLLNGLAMHTKAWYPFLGRLHPGLDVLLFDYPGQGESTSLDLAVDMPGIAGHLDAIAAHLALPPLHVVGVSYGGFVALEFARTFPARVRTMTLSGILMSHEALFEMYEALSLRFYRGGPEAFDLYTHYMYEKIFGEDFVRAVGPERLEAMRQRFFDRYKDRVHSLIRLTEAQDPMFAALDGNRSEYLAIAAPTLILPGAEDRAIPLSQQRKLLDLLPHARWEPVAGSGHVVYLEKPDVFWPRLRAFVAEHDRG
jgi:pimeloyl-ACP methyl ester carboxylesterase